MTDEEKYELLKANMVKAYTDYINHIQRSTFASLDSAVRTIQVSDKYIQAVKESVAFNDFVRDYLKRKKAST